MPIIFYRFANRLWKRNFGFHRLPRGWDARNKYRHHPGATIGRRFSSNMALRIAPILGRCRGVDSNSSRYHRPLTATACVRISSTPPGSAFIGCNAQRGQRFVPAAMPEVCPSKMRRVRPNKAGSSASYRGIRRRPGHGSDSCAKVAANNDFAAGIGRPRPLPQAQQIGELGKIDRRCPAGFERARPRPLKCGISRTLAKLRRIRSHALLRPRIAGEVFAVERVHDRVKFEL